VFRVMCVTMAQPQGRGLMMRSGQRRVSTRDSYAALAPGCGLEKDATDPKSELPVIRPAGRGRAILQHVPLAYDAGMCQRTEQFGPNRYGKDRTAGVRRAEQADLRSKTSDGLET
jgi:hypothetical protein